MADFLDDDFFNLDEDLFSAPDCFEHSTVIGNKDRICSMQHYAGMLEINHRDYSLISFSENTQVKESVSPRYFNCLGEDALSKNYFHSESFLRNGEINLINSSNKNFCNQNIFELSLSEDLLIDSRMLQNLVNEAR